MKSGDDLVNKSAVQLRKLIGEKSVSPVDVVNAFIDQIESLNPYVNAIAATSFSQARKLAKKAELEVLNGESLGILHGLPIGIKDIEPTKGILTTYGSASFRNHIPDNDSAVVEKIKLAGGIVTCKTNIPEMAAGGNTRNTVWGATGNPFNPNLNAGGSSGGSAAALALNMLPLCTGSDTGGSLRIPAAICGVVGMRPSPGLVPYSNKQLGWSPITVVGPLARKVEDIGLLLAATAGLDSRDPSSYPIDPASFLNLDEMDLSKLKVAWTEDFGVCEIDSGIRDGFREKIQKISKHFNKCDQIDLNLKNVHQCFDILRAEFFVAGTKEMYDKNPSSLGQNTRANYEMGAKMSMLDVAWAQSEQTRLFQLFQELYREYDLILAPTLPVTPFPWTNLFIDQIGGRKLDNYYRWIALTYIVTMVTNPTIALPCGVDYAGMPFGIQVIGGFKKDQELLRAAVALETVFEADPDLRRPVPNLDCLIEANPALTSIITDPPGEDYHYVKMMFAHY